MKKIKISSFKDVKSISNLTLSKDEKSLFYCVSTVNMKKNIYESRIHKMDIESQKEYCLTHQGKESSFILLKNKDILFPAKRTKEDEKKGVSSYYRLPLEGGEASHELTIPCDGITSILELKKDHYLLTVAFNRDKELAKVNEKKKDPEDYDDTNDYNVLSEIPFWSNGTGFTNSVRMRLALYKKGDDKVEYLTDDFTSVYGLKLNEKQDKAVYLATTYSGKMPLVSNMFVLDIEDKKSKQMGYKEFGYSYCDFLGDDIIFIGSSMERFGINENSKIYLVKNDETSLLSPEDYDNSFWNSVGSDIRYGAGKSFKVQDDKFYFINTNNYSSNIKSIDSDGNITTEVDNTSSIDFFDVGKTGIFYVEIKEDSLQEIYRKDGESTTKLSNINKIASKWKLSKIEKFPFTNDGYDFTGFVIPPIGYEKGKKYPGILAVHGGPKTVYGDIFYHEMQLFAAKGYFVFYTNPRGSDGGGNDFADIRGKYGTIDYDDLMKFTDLVLEKYPDINRDKIAFTGGSYGGFMANWVIGHTHRFAAVCSQRSISNWISKFNTTDIGYYFVDDQCGGNPWDDHDKLWEQSPLKYADKVITPTLFIHSDEDYRCWMAEGIQMFTALKYHGVDSRLVLFKKENHELSRSGLPQHRKRRLKEILDWFDLYLK